METHLISPGRAVLEKMLDIAFIPLLGLILLGRVQDFPATTIIIIVVGVIYTTRNVLAEEGGLRDIGFNWVDISTLVVMTSEIFNYFASTYRLNTLSSLVDVSFLFLLYWTIRVNLKHELETKVRQSYPMRELRFLKKQTTQPGTGWATWLTDNSNRLRQSLIMREH